MNILGVSGLESAMQFKKQHWPGFPEREYRIVQGQDAAAALVVDGKVVAAAAEERFDRQKHSPRFPINSIQYCLARAGISIDDVDEIAHSFDYAPYRKLFSLDPVSDQLYREVYSKEALLALVHRDFPEIPCGASASSGPPPVTCRERLLHVRMGRVSGSRRRWNGRSARRVGL